MIKILVSYKKPVILQWIPSYGNITGNEIEDQLTKRAHIFHRSIVKYLTTDPK